MPYTNDTLGTAVQIYEKDSRTGFATFAGGPGAPSTDANQYAPGCLFVNRAAGTLVTNTGTAAAPVWTAS